MLRRDFLKKTAISSLAMVSGCETHSRLPGTPGAGQPIIDAHCHLFNASDLPSTRFLRQVVFRSFPPQALKTRGVWDPDLADLSFGLALTILGADRAPTAQQEIDYLGGKVPPIRDALSKDRARSAAIADASGFLMLVDRKRRGQIAKMAASGAADAEPSAEARFLDIYVGSAAASGLDTKRVDSVLSTAQARSASVNAFTNMGAVSRYLNWFSLFRLYRHVLTDMLVHDTEKQGFRPVMLTPLLVDYDEWLFEDVKTPLSEQMRVMDHVSRRPGDRPAVHGFIGFDPLREVAFKAGIAGTVSSLETARRALSEHGFAGVKLYPPMGFRPSGNKGPYPKRTVKRLGFEPDRQLDAALNSLYALCVELDAPIIAHGYDSNEAGPKYGARGDPAFWLPVFERYPDLRVCIAHFGRFDAKSHGKTGRLPEISWEWTLGDYIRQKPDSPVFGDISYFSEAVNATEDERLELAAYLKRWVSEFDPGVDHLVFGTDWIMLGQEDGYSRYIEDVNAFLRTLCGFDDGQCDKIFRRNAMRFLPLQRWSRGRQRLLEWYERTGVDPARLPVAAPELLSRVLGR